MDGTFKVAPTIFTQLYVIRVPLADSAISCIYAFTQRKGRDTYESLLLRLVEKAEELNLFLDPEVIITDFELAALNAISSVLGPHVRTKCCFFHLTQSTWRKLQELGLTNAYRTNADVRHFVGMIDGIAFLPLDIVSDGIFHLKDNLPVDLDDETENALNLLLDYFDKTYITGTLRHGRDGNAIAIRRIPPIFSQEKWNVFDTTLHGEDRTNNFCESWNRAFQQLVGYHHPTISTAIDGIRKDNVIVHTTIEKDNLGERPKSECDEKHSS